MPTSAFPRRPRQLSALGVLALLLVVAGTVLEREAGRAAPPVTPATGAGGAAVSAATGAGGAASSGLQAADPPHDAVQPFPPAGSCQGRTEGTGDLPDPRCTPGAVNPRVTQATIATTICRSGGYTSSIRPAARITDPEKAASMRAYSDTGSPRGYEFDHLVSLELGGSPNAPANLWPEPGGSPNPKDKLETRLHTLVCGHQLSLADAQRAVSTDWVAAYRQYLGGDPAPVGSR